MPSRQRCPLIDAFRHELTINLPPEPLWVEGDPTRLEQIVSNLLNNAAKYTEPGGRITVTLGREADQAVLRVQDTGIGMTPELQNRIFDLFVQADRSLDRAGRARNRADPRSKSRRIARRHGLGFEPRTRARE